MGETPSDLSIYSADSSPFVAPSRWVNPRLHVNPGKLQIGGGDMGANPTTPLPRNPRKNKFFLCAGDVASAASPPPSSEDLLRSDPLVPACKRPRYFTDKEIAEEEDIPTRLKPSIPFSIWGNMSKWGNLRRPFTAAEENSPPLETVLDLSRGRHPRNPLTAMKSPSGELAGYVGANPLGKGLAGRAVEMGSPAQSEGQLSVEGEESSFDLSPIKSLAIPSCDKEMWDEAVVNADR